jgi:type 1 glutamine amidotransferase
MYKHIAFFLLFVGLVGSSQGKALPEIRLDANWKQNIAERAPKVPQVEAKEPRKVLIFSLATGFKHWCIPHTQAVIEILGEESGAYESVSSLDVEVFRPERLREFDAVVLNNNCPTREKRDMFYDVLVKLIGEEGKKYADMPLKEREELAALLYRSLVDYVAEGGGLVLLHGAIANFAQSEEFSDLMGGHFVGHPSQQEVTLYPVTPDHPVLKPFRGQPFVHYDEPYVLGGAYEKFNFAPMLELETSTIKPSNKAEKLGEMPRYVAWIKPYKKGRVFFSSPSHNAQSFHRPELLAFLLNGMQYALGDLKCDDQPLKK